METIHRNRLRPPGDRYNHILKIIIPQFTAIFNKVITERNVDTQDRIEFKRVAAQTGFALLNVPI